MKQDYELLKLKPDSVESGLCVTCSHLVGGVDNGGCDTKRPCGQVLACRCQARVLAFGRQPSGRVRTRPLARSQSKQLEDKPQAWKKFYEHMKDVGDGLGCIWIQFLSRSQQVTVRRLIKAGKLTVVHVDGVFVRRAPVVFLDKKELNDKFENWEVSGGSGD